MEQLVSGFVTGNSSDLNVKICTTYSDLPEFLKCVKTAHKRLKSWRRVAKEFDGIPPGTLCTYAKTGYLPNRYRQRLGLPVVASVAPVMEPIPNGAQALFAVRCECGRWYISNHPRRKRCYLCSPYRAAKTLTRKEN